MKNIFKVLFLTLLISSCREDLITESTVVDEPIPTNTYLYEFGVFGLVVDEDGEAIDQALITANGIAQMSDDNGYFEYEELDGSEEGVYVSAEKGGYVDGGVLVIPNEDNTQQIRIVLIKDNSSTLIANSDGGSLSLQNGSEVIIPANAFVTDGDINVSAYFIPSTKENFDEVYPSSFVGKDADNVNQYLKSIGAVSVEFTDDNGNEIKLNDNVEVMLRLPIPQDANTWPDEIRLWSLNESTGYWTEESSAQRVGDFYEGSVDHFSWWSACEPENPIDMCFSIKDEGGQPLPNLELFFLSWTTASIQSGFTDDEGVFCTTLGEGEDVILFIPDECSFALHDENFTVSSEITEKEIIISSLPTPVRFEGVVRTCDGDEVQDGYLSFDFGYDRRVVQVENGAYSFTSYCSSPDDGVEVFAVDRSDFSTSMITIDVSSNVTSYVNDITLCETLETFMVFNNLTQGREILIPNCEALKNPVETLIRALEPNSSENVLIGVEGFTEGEFGANLVGPFSEFAGAETFQTTITSYQNVGGFVVGTFVGVTDQGESVVGEFKALRVK